MIDKQSHFILGRSHFKKPKWDAFSLVIIGKVPKSQNYHQYLPNIQKHEKHNSYNIRIYYLVITYELFVIYYIFTKNIRALLYGRGHFYMDAGTLIWTRAGYVDDTNTDVLGWGSIKSMIIIVP